ncbi:type II toxin-antitoxin system PemK/MazF family toxin [candidate division KSB1 bacterium]|nr:type II toxin-antitoxin system PemK/MazF family toxin [candidate division KSB1 bacterium]
MTTKEIHRGEIYFVDLNPTQGREQAGQRPVLVLSIDAINKLPLVVTVVVGTKGANISRDYPTNIRISPAESGLSLETVFMGFQIRSLDPSRFPDAPAGKISDSVLEKVENVVRYCLGL